MKRFGRLVTVVTGLALAAGIARAEAPAATGKGNPMVVFTTSLGDIKVELFPDKAPVTMKNFLEYVRSGYYDGTVFHRVIPGFMIQGGGMDKDIRDKGGQRPPIKNESSNNLSNTLGTLAMARTPDPNSATAQFFINVKDNKFLDKAQAQDGFGYCVFGKVIEGMDVVDKIKDVKTGKKDGHGDVPLQDVIIKSVRRADK